MINMAHLGAGLLPHSFVKVKFSSQKVLKWILLRSTKDLFP